MCNKIKKMEIIIKTLFTILGRLGWDDENDKMGRFRWDGESINNLCIK